MDLVTGDTINVVTGRRAGRGLAIRKPRVKLRERRVYRQIAFELVFLIMK